MTSPKIYKSNALIEASYTLSVAEQRIILACIAQVDRGQPITDDVMYSVPVAEIALATGSDSKSMYSELFEAARKLRRRDVHIYMEPNGGGRKEKKLKPAGYRPSPTTNGKALSSCVLTRTCCLTSRSSKSSSPDIICQTSPR